MTFNHPLPQMVLTGDFNFMWNDTDIPLAFLITFRSYGTWLHGDERSSISRHKNQYKSLRLPQNEKWLDTNTQRLKSEIVTLNAEQRNAVEKAVRETCDIRQWHLQAINVRTNHVHTVVSIGAKKPEIALNAFKANATEKCAKAVVGRTKKLRGRTKAAKDIYGMKKASRRRLIMSSTVKAMTCLILIEVRTACGSGRFKFIGYDFLGIFTARELNHPRPQMVLTRRAGQNYLRYGAVEH